MSTTPTTTAAERYDRALHGANARRQPLNYPVPQPTAAWPEENVALLELYRDWLLSSSLSLNVINQIYIPMAGHALGLNLKPHSQLDIDADVERSLDYVKAKQLSAEWIDMCRCALEKFRLFLRQQRGYTDVVIRPLNRDHYHAGLPDWVIKELEQLQRIQQPNWRPARINEQIMRFWSGHSRVWRWLSENYTVTSLTDIKRQYLFDYVDHRLAAGYAPSGINSDLRYFHAFLIHLQDQGYQVPQALLRIPRLKQPDRLPRFLTDEQVRLLRDDFERRGPMLALPANGATLCLIEPPSICFGKVVCVWVRLRTCCWKISTWPNAASPCVRARGARIARSISPIRLCACYKITWKYAGWVLPITSSSTATNQCTRT